jgi:hypothetical protein
MKTRLLGALVGLALGFALPVFAQEQNTVDPEVRQQIEVAVKKHEEAYNRYDAAAYAALYTLDAIEVLSWERNMRDLGIYSLSRWREGPPSNDLCS